VEKKSEKKADDQQEIMVVLLAIITFRSNATGRQEVTVDVLMRLRSVSDVQISPDGKQIAYVVSTPSFESAAHEAILYRIPSPAERRFD